ncbi:penicillin-binding protein [Candidatus Roizmanbacteria bacterium]|jgi:1A family penicillin-binding protein|nr:penicillin-binding protein [Candidatus Roizmanbacteria bacterium]
MKKRSALAELSFKLIFYLINFFIVIGEWTQKIPLLIFFFFANFFKKIFLWTKGALIFHSPKINLPKKKPLPKLKFKGFKIRKKLRFLSRLIPKQLTYFLFGSIFTLFVFFIYQSYVFVNNLPSPYNIGKINYPLTTHILDRNGKLLYEVYREQNRTPIKLTDLPEYVTQATVAIEDKDFYRHNGVSVFSGILRAMKENILKKDFQGGSTITQQLVKTALLSPEKTIERKIKEIILAIWAERIYSKKQILEMYLNQVPYGGSSYGIEEASRTYFGKRAQDLTLEEAAFLAGLPQAPSIYSPYVNPDLALKRRNEVLEKMFKQGYINENSKIKGQNSKLEIVPLNTSIRAPHFVFYVKSQLENKYGIREVEEGGLQVTTTLDIELQEEAEKILKEELDKVKNLNVNNGAILVTRPSTGEILAMVGSADYFAAPSGAFNDTIALRQPGSSIKPIMYSLALSKNYTAATVIDDSPTVFSVPGSESYRPVNYDGRFHGKIPLRIALANSFNIPAVKVLSTVGVSDFVDHAKKMGITTWGDSSRFGLSLTLGGGEVKMVDMATAFGVLANKGYRVNLESFTSVKKNNEPIYSITGNGGTKILDEGVAYIMSDILSDNFARQWAFGTRSSLEISGYKVAVKTGTTDEKKDNWTIGYTPDFLVATWVGNNDNQPMNPYLSSGITGAAPIWNRVMTYVLKKYNISGNSWYSQPDNVIEKNCYFGRKEYFIKGTENKVSCQSSLFNQSPTPTP